MTDTPKADKPEGWAFPGTARKCHYFVGSESLCRKWGFYFGRLEADTGKPSRDDCTACQRELGKRAAAEVTR